MGSTERRAVRTARRARRTLIDVGSEIRDARRGAGLSQRDAGRPAGLSHSQVSRLELGRVANASVSSLVRLCDAVGLDLAVRAYPGGNPVRDVAHVRLLGRLRERVHPSIRWSAEVPVTPDDLRAWDVMLRGPDWSVAVEAETRLTDVQALLRRLALKRRDGRVASVILLVADTRLNRAALRGAEQLIADDYPASGREILRALGEGRDPGSSGLVVC